jgi:hypothetical protein
MYNSAKGTTFYILLLGFVIMTCAHCQKNAEIGETSFRVYYIECVNVDQVILNNKKCKYTWN